MAGRCCNPAPLDEHMVSAGHWVIAGYDVRRVSQAGSVKRWVIKDSGGNKVGQRDRLDDARVFIRGLLGSKDGQGRAGLLLPLRAAAYRGRDCRSGYRRDAVSAASS
jgi:hypothetical protein